MLKGLLANLPPPAMAVPPVLSQKKQREPLQPTDYGAVPLVPPVPPEKTETKLKSEIFAIIGCYTPNGQLIKVEANNALHAEFLQRMNPMPHRPASNQF